MKKRILFVTYNYWPPQFGGELLLSIERFQGLAARGYKITVLTAGHPDYPPFREEQGLNIHRSPVIGQGRVARLLRRLVFFTWVCWMMFRQEFDIYHQGDSAGIDIVSSALEVRTWALISYIRRARRVIVYSLADTEKDVFYIYGWKGFWKRYLYNSFDEIVAVSPGLYQGLQNVFPERACLIINGVRDDLFVPLGDLARKCFRLEYNVAENDVIFAFLGTVGKRKGFDLLAEAFVNLAQQYLNWRLWIIGPYTVQQNQNIDVQEVVRLTNILASMDAKVKYWGRVDDREQLNRLLSTSDIFVFPSRREGMGLAPIEAMATGIPAIIARIPNITDLASVDGETGYYIPIDDVESLEAAMEKLGRDQALRKKMGQNAVRRVHDGFGWKDHLDRWEEFYSHLNPFDGSMQSDSTRMQ